MMSDWLISDVFLVPESSSRRRRAHLGPDLPRWNDRQVSHAHQIVGRASEGKDPVHFADPTMAHLPHQCNRLQPAKAFFDPLLFLWLIAYPRWRAVRPSIALPPDRLDRYMVSDDPEFESKAADILGLYLHPPQHAAVFCIDEKTAIQALDRLDPVLPLSPGRAERHGFEYYRHGIRSLYAALNTATGRVPGKTAARHTSREFVTANTAGRVRVLPVDGPSIGGVGVDVTAKFAS